MRSIFETCTPRHDVLSGELRDDMFAARLGDVVAGRADPVYQDPQRFFANTFPTNGMRSLLSTTLGRLAGLPDGDPVIKLETTFGGGKTHNLIALYHLAAGRIDQDLAGRFVDPERLPRPGSVTIAAIVGDEMDPGGVPRGGIATHTVWGELAYRIGGEEGYRKVEGADRARGPAPACHFIDELLGDRPLLIMVDEIARHLRSASAVDVGESNLARQTVAFFMSLLEFVSSRPRTAIVFTLASGQDAFAEETAMVVRETESVAARRELALTPAEETERPAIVAHRLFQQIDRSAIDEVVDGYMAYYLKAEDQGADVPERALRGEYATDMKLHYPFHPELLLTLNRKTSTIPNFQSTRGALRLLAATVRNLWRKKPPETYLIHPYHLDLSDESVLNDLTSRLGRQAFRQVVEADIATPTPGSVAHAAEIDRQFTEAGKPPYATRAATTIFLHSLVQGVASGVDPTDLTLATLQPGDDPALFKRALDQLVDRCWHLDWDGRYYRFKTEPSLNKVIEDEKVAVGRTKAKEELDQRIRVVWKKGFLQPIYFPSEAADVDDDAQEPKVCVIHYDAAAIRSPEDGPPELVRKIAEHAGTQQGFRSYPNHVLFLVADATHVDAMVEQARRYLAIERIVGDHDRMAEFNEEQRKRLRQMLDAADLEVRVAITRAYRYLFYPSSDAPAQHAYLHCQTLPPQDQGDVKKDQTQVVLRVLKDLDKTLTADDPPLAPAYVKGKAWPKGADRVTTEELRKTFARQRNLKLLLDVNQLKTTIKKGIESGLWVYYDAAEGVGYAADSPPPLVQIGADFELLTPEEAARTNVPIKGRGARQEEVCPVCGGSPCTCAERLPHGPEGEPVPHRPTPAVLRSDGPPGQALQAIVDQAADAGIERIERLVLTCDGTGAEAMDDVQRLGLAIPQLPKADLTIGLHLTAEYGAGETLKVDFTGGWDRYKRLKQVTDPMGREASRVSARIVVTAAFPGGLRPDSPDMQTIRDVLASIGLGPVTLEAVPAGQEAAS